MHHPPLTGDGPLAQGSPEEDLTVVSRNRLAETITGGLSWPGEMEYASRTESEESD
jgi:hypothetical protein